MQDEPNAPVSQLEVREFVEPFLKKGAEMSTLAQIADRYLSKKIRPPKMSFMHSTSGPGYMLVRERKPTKAEAAHLGDRLVDRAKLKNRCASLEELEDKGQLHLNDWLRTMKENARKRFETFLKHKERADLASNESFNSLLEAVFDIPSPKLLEIIALGAGIFWPIFYPFSEALEG